MDSINRIWTEDHMSRNILDGSNEPRQLQWSEFPDFLIHDRVQNAAASGIDYLEAEAGLNYLLGGEEQLYIPDISQPSFSWDGLDHFRLTGREGPAAGQNTHSRWSASAAVRPLSNSI